MGKEGVEWRRSDGRLAGNLDTLTVENAHSARSFHLSPVIFNLILGSFSYIQVAMHCQLYYQ